MKKVILLLIILTLSGCWNYQELNNYAIVTGMSIDYKNDNFEVGLLIANDNKNNTNKASLLTGSGETIYEAIKNISLAVPKELYISHLSLIVISEDLAKHGIKSSIDFLMRDPASHQNFYIVIAKDVNAYDTLSLITPLSDYSSKYIESNIDATSKLQGKIADASFNNLVKTIVEPGIEPIINSIILISNDTKEESTKQNKYVKLSNIGIFKEDKLLGWLNNDESIGANILLNNIEDLYIKIKYNNKNIILTTKELKLNKKVYKDKIVIDIKVNGIINETTSININNSKDIDNIKNLGSKEIIECINKAIKKSKYYNSDIFGFGNNIYHKYPNYYKNIDWNKKYKELKIEVNAEYNITNKGSLKKTI